MHLLNAVEAHCCTTDSKQVERYMYVAQWSNISGRFGHVGLHQLNNCTRLLCIYLIASQFNSPCDAALLLCRCPEAQGKQLHNHNLVSELQEYDAVIRKHAKCPYATAPPGWLYNGTGDIDRLPQQWREHCCRCLTPGQSAHSGVR